MSDDWRKEKETFFRQAAVVLMRLSIMALPDCKASLEERGISEASRWLKFPLMQIFVRSQGQNAKTFGVMFILPLL